MILDSFLLFSGGGGGVGNGDGATDSPTTGTQVSSNVIDLGIVSGIPSYANGGGARDIGVGDDPSLKLLATITTVFAGGTSLGIILQGAPDNGSGVPATFSTWYSSPTFALATLAAGARLLDMDMPRPPAGIAVPRFLKLVYTTVSVCNPTIAAYIVIDRDDQPYSSTDNSIIGGYQAGINVAN